MLFFIVKMASLDTRAGCSDNKTKLETTKMSQFNHNTPKANIQISEWTNGIFIDRESYSKIFRHQFNLYSTSSCALFKYYM